MPSRMAFCALLFSALLALFGPFGAAAGPADDAYIAARDQYLAALAAAEKAGKGAEELEKQDAAASKDLETRMIALLGPVRFKGVGAEPTFSPGVLLDGDIDSGKPDGLLFFADEDATRVFVSPEPVFLNWLATAAKAQDIPAFRDGLRAAMASDDFYRLTVGADAAFTPYMELPLASREGEAVQAFLGLFAQDNPANASPNAVVVARVANGRVTVGTMELKTPIKAIPACSQVWKRHSAEADRLRTAIQKGKSTDDPRWDKVYRIEEESADAYRRCFAEAIKKLPAFTEATKRAEMLLQVLQGN